jgi:hypothetical protein
VAQLLVRLKTCSEKRPISVKSLRRYIAQGKITGYRIGPKLLCVDLNEVDALLVKRVPTAGGGQ